jgi:hypothetical protein
MTVEFEPIEPGRVEYRLIERDIFTSQSAVALSRDHDRQKRLGSSGGRWLTELL